MMWTPPLSRSWREILIESTYIDSDDSDGSDEHDSDISSSTSSDSSDESEDDKMPISEVLKNLKPLSAYPDLQDIIYPDEQRKQLKFVLLVRQINKYIKKLK